MNKFLLIAAALVGLYLFTFSPGESMSDTERRCERFADARAPAGSASVDSFMSIYRACVARNTETK